MTPDNACKCPLGTFLNITAQSCDNCDPECKVCSDNANACLVCNLQRNLLVGRVALRSINTSILRPIPAKCVISQVALAGVPYPPNVCSATSVSSPKQITLALLSLVNKEVCWLIQSSTHASAAILHASPASAGLLDAVRPVNLEQSEQSDVNAFVSTHNGGAMMVSVINVTQIVTPVLVMDRITELSVYQGYLRL